MATILAVPVHVDALYSGSDIAVIPAETDFSRLPYRTTKGDINPELAWLGERIAYQPFDEDRLRLKAGVHLHWRLPEALRTGRNRGRIGDIAYDDALVRSLGRRKLPPDIAPDMVATDETVVVEERSADGKTDRWRVLELKGGGSATIRLWLVRGEKRLRIHVYEPNFGFPPAPNRWLIRRQGFGAERFWLVESDYLHDLEPEVSERQPPIQFPVLPPPDESRPYQWGKDRPYQWLGLVHEFSGGLPDELPAARMSGQKSINLTAIGYGNPSFAAFYPNCHSVFGFHDPQITTPPDDKLEYHVVGWHSDRERDALKLRPFVIAQEEAKERYGRVDHPTNSDFDLALHAEALRTAYGWKAKGFPEPPELKKSPLSQKVFPSRTFLVGKVRPKNDVPSDTLNCKVAIGHTGTEALSAYAAATLGRPDLENQLEGLHLWPKLEGVRIDVGPKFGEARHEKEFSPFDAGRRWTFALRDSPLAEPLLLPDGKRVTIQSSSNLLSLLEELNPLLKSLNRAEADFDQKAAKLSALRRQLYAEWCKYLLCVYPPLGEQDHYPDMDTVRLFIESHTLKAVEQAHLSRRTAREKRELALRDLEEALATKGGKQPPLKLKVRPPPRFWAPKEPSILLVGEDLPAPSRRDPATALTCTVHDIPDFGADDAVTREQAKELANIAASHRADVSEHQGQPIFLDWQIHLKPLFEGSNLPPDVHGFRPDFVTSKFEFDPDSADLRLQDTAELPSPKSPWTQYRGRSILTPHIGRHLRNAIEGWLRRVLSIDAAEAEKDAAEAEKDFVEKAQASLGQTKNEIAASIFAAYERLFVSPAPPFIAQALTGFNAALLMQRQTVQLPIADPLGFPEDRDFAERVAIAVGSDKRSSPMPLTEFHPIRTGLMEIEALRLIDNFGLVREIAFDGALIPAKPMRVTVPGHKQTALLRPRLVQPSRLKFRWLDAGAKPGQTTEAMELRSGTAVCGWIVRDLLGDDLLVHAANGAPLGRITAGHFAAAEAAHRVPMDDGGHWHQAPGSPRIAPWQIENDNLARLVVHLLRSPGDQLRNFLHQMVDRLQRIVPDEFAAHDGASFLVGRPLAVVRASLELQLYGPAASRHDWNVFRQELASDALGGKSPDNFDSVRFAVRLGDDGQLNDGLVAFWEETHIKDGRCCLEERSDVALSVTDGMRFVTMLIDPRAPVHARTGILPTKSISVPKAHYADIIGHLDLALPAGPVLMPEGAISVFTPDTSRYDVTWVQHEQGEWRESPIAGAPSARAEWQAPTVVRHGWLKLAAKQAATDQTNSRGGENNGRR
jgi:hypothetical protein